MELDDSGTSNWKLNSERASRPAIAQRALLARRQLGKLAQFYS